MYIYIYFRIRTSVFLSVCIYSYIRYIYIYISFIYIHIHIYIYVSIFRRSQYSVCLDGRRCMAGGPHSGYISDSPTSIAYMGVIYFRIQNSVCLSVCICYI